MELEMNELPAIASTTNSFTNYDGVGIVDQLTTSAVRQWDPDQIQEALRHGSPEKLTELKGAFKMPKKRLVQVFIADPDAKMPLDDSLIYEGKTLLTDSDDEELFFDLPIKELLVKHNEKRIKVVDKKATDKSFVQYLEPIRIRELKMTVVTLAEF